MKLIVERWIQVRDPYSDELVDTIADEKVVTDENEAKEVAEEFKADSTTVKVTLHYCYNDEDPPRRCRRIEI